MASDHKTHDYTIHPSGGGVCDCGDPQAWRPSGFCTKHSGVKENFEPSEVLPPSVVNTAQVTIQVIMDLLMELLVKYEELVDLEDDSSLTMEEVISSQIEFLLSLLNQMQGIGEVFKSILLWRIIKRDYFTLDIVARQLGSPGSFSKFSSTCAMEKLIEYHQHFGTLLKLYAKELYFSLIVDYTFKRYITTLRYDSN
jgi:hypothetical protein